MRNQSLDKEKVVSVLNQIMESELAGTVRYTHYALMVFGKSRIPICSWLRAQADENLAHAHQAGEMVTHLGAHPSLAIGTLLETHQHDLDQILKEALESEYKTLQLYYQLLELVSDKSILLEEYARELIRSEELHIGEIDKMIRKPGDIEISKEVQTL